MLGPQHRLAGATAGAGYATAVHAPYVVVVASALIATVSAGGPLSPDLDQSSWWRVLPYWPGMRHRGLSHWWGLPVVAWFALVYLPPSLTVVGTALVIGWASHLVADLPFGKVPLTPWASGYVGLTFDTGGFVETVIVRAALILTLVWLLVYLPARAVLGGH